MDFSNTFGDLFFYFLHCLDDSEFLSFGLQDIIRYGAMVSVEYSFTSFTPRSTLIGQIDLFKNYRSNRSV